MYHNLYSYFAIDKHLNSFQLLVITNKATKDILVPISTYSCVLFTLQITLHFTNYSSFAHQWNELWIGSHWTLGLWTSES